MMISRLLPVLTVAATLLGAIGASAQPWRYSDPDEMLSGGRPFGGLFGGTSPIARTTVAYPGNHRPGTIVINTAERRLYLVTSPGQAIRYGIGVGRDGFTWSGVRRITAKKEWPSWTPPKQCWSGGPTCRVTWKAAWTIPWARARCILARRSTASTARTSRRPSARRCPR